MKICIIGMGLMGGSLAMKLKPKCSDIIGVDINEDNIRDAYECGIINGHCSLEDCTVLSDVIILATPVNTSKWMIEGILDNMNTKQTLIDLGSTKAEICEVIKSHPNRKRFVAAHPIAGNEKSGVIAARPNLYNDKVMILCDTELSSKESLDVARDIFDMMNIVEMDSKEHDKHIAFVSHLSHISSFILGQTVLDEEKNEKDIFMMAGSGFDSTVRLAKSSPDMWTPIMTDNKVNILSALDSYIDNLNKFREMIDNSDENSIHELLSDVNRIGEILK
jgi:prephenate dehydrogenase